MKTAFSIYEAKAHLSRLIAEVSRTGKPITSGLTAIDYTGKIPTNYSFSAGIQAKLPWAVVLDTSYVGLLSRQQLFNTNINAAPYGHSFQGRESGPEQMGVWSDAHSRARWVVRRIQGLRFGLYPPPWERRARN